MGEEQTLAIDNFIGKLPIFIPPIILYVCHVLNEGFAICSPVDIRENFAKCMTSLYRLIPYKIKHWREYYLVKCIEKHLGKINIGDLDEILNFLHCTIYIVVICTLVFVVPSVPLNTSIVERSVIQYENLHPQLNVICEGVYCMAHFVLLHMFLLKLEKL